MPREPNWCFYSAAKAEQQVLECNFKTLVRRSVAILVTLQEVLLEYIELVWSSTYLELNVSNRLIQMDSIMNLIDITLTESPLELKELRKLRDNLNEDRLEELSIFMYLTHVDGKVCKTVLLEQAKTF